MVILANGPSLRQTISDHALQLRAMPTIAVNFMANTAEYQELRPDYYVLADPHFFRNIADENVARLWRNLAATSWPMCLNVPAAQRRVAEQMLGPDSKVTVATFNFVGVEGFEWFERLAYSRRLGMPRPRNVLMPAFATAIAAGFTTIYVAGADHSWLKTIGVNDRNEVVSVQPHFYADPKGETARSTAEYRGYRLHDILKSFYVAFESYHRLRRFTDSRHISIINITPGSFIDAFTRGSL